MKFINISTSQMQGFYREGRSEWRPASKAINSCKNGDRQKLKSASKSICSFASESSIEPFSGNKQMS